MTSVQNIYEPNAEYQAVIVTPAGVVPRSISNDGSTTDANVVGTVYAVCAVKIQAGMAGTLTLKSLSLQVTSNDSGEWFVCKNPTVSGTFTYNPVASTIHEFAVGDTPNVVTAQNLRLFGGQVEGSDNTIVNALTTTDTINNDSDTWVLCFRPYTSNADVYGTINFDEEA